MACFLEPQTESCSLNSSARAAGQHLSAYTSDEGRQGPCPSCQLLLTIPENRSFIKPSAAQYTEQKSPAAATAREAPIGSGKTRALIGSLLLLGILAIALWAFYTDRITTADLSSGFLNQIVERVVDNGYIAQTNHETEISSVLSQKDIADVGSRTVFQQFANGSYRLADMLAIIARQLDTRGSNSSAIASILSQKALNDISTEDAIQQGANGTYRCVELLALVAREADRKNNYSSEIQSVLSQMRLNDISAKSAHQQIANGTYRMAEMLAIACKAADRNNRFNSEISSALSQMTVAEISSRTAPQQAANGLFTSARLMAIFAQLMDRKGNYAVSISGEITQMSLNDISSETAFQQMANAFYRLTDIAGYAAKGLNP